MRIEPANHLVRVVNLLGVRGHSVSRAGDTNEPGCDVRGLEGGLHVLRMLQRDQVVLVAMETVRDNLVYGH